MDEADLLRHAAKRKRVNVKRAQAILGIAADFVPALHGTARVLEYGCNTGAATAQFARAGHRATGVDVDPQVLDKAREQCGDVEGLGFIECHGTLPFEDATFDFVYSSEVIEHVPLDERDLYLGEFRRVLKPSGVGYMSYPNFWFPIEQHHFVPFQHWMERVFRTGRYRYVDIPSKYQLRSRLREDFVIHDVGRRFYESEYARDRYPRLVVQMANLLYRTPLSQQDYLILEPR